MARIVYGVHGDSNGHISRSLTVAELLRGHEILFVGGGNTEQVRQKGYAFEPLPLLVTAQRDNRVCVTGTVRNFAELCLRQPRTVRRLAEIIRAFDPALVITDYEHFTPPAARQAGYPCLSLDHHHVITNTLYEAIPGQRVSRLLMQTAIRCMVGDPGRCFMVSFQQQPLRRPDRDAIFGILPREDVLACHPADGEHVAVYLRKSHLDRIVSLLGGRRREYRLYGFGARPARGNLRFCEISRAGFLADLAGAAYVVSNAGHGLLSEALCLGKPVFCLPTRLHYEQHWNAAHVQRSGFGGYFPDIDRVTPHDVDAFEARLDTFRAAIRARSLDGRARLAASLNALLA